MELLHVFLIHLNFLKFVDDFANGEIFPDATSLVAKYSLIVKFGILLLNFADNFADGETSLELCQHFANG